MRDVLGRIAEVCISMLLILNEEDENLVLRLFGNIKTDIYPQHTSEQPLLNISIQIYLGK